MNHVNKILLACLVVIVFSACTALLVMGTKSKHDQRMKFIQDSMRLEDSMQHIHPSRLPYSHTHKNYLK
jgi:hypothetical protein